MTSSDLDKLVVAAARRYLDAAALVAASLVRVGVFEATRAYTADELEPYDALCDRYLRAVEMGVRYFRTTERARLAVNSESYRDLLGNVAKWGFIDDVDLWFLMRDLRNRIAHDYLPEQMAEIHRLIRTAYGPELLRLAGRISRL
jgi:hypothetical protein